MKLSHKTLRLYLICSGITFALSVPIFYLLAQRLWMNDVDESLLQQKQSIIAGMKSQPFDSVSVTYFNDIAHVLDLNVSITPVGDDPIPEDSIYYKTVASGSGSQTETVRILSSYISVNGTAYRIELRKALLETSDLIQGIVIAQAILFLVLLIGTVILNTYFSRKIWSPFYRLVRQLQSFRLDRKEEIPVEKTAILEFDTLQRCIQKLIETNIHIFQAQKEFTENAAHETRNALTAIQNQVDFAAQEEGLSVNQARILSRIGNNVRHLIKLNRDLLLLSRIDNDRFDLNENVDIYEVITEVAGNFEEQLGMLGLSLRASATAQPQIRSNRQLLRSLFVNLFTNAMRHNTQGGWIEIKLDEHSFEIANTGLARELQANKIFERFYKHSDRPESTGLGLAIVRRVSKLLDLRVAYQFRPENIHSFKVNL